MSAATATLAPVTETLTVAPSKFIAMETGKFERSHTRIYLALILDVIHGHKGETPKGYAAMLAEVAPHVTMWPKYCTVIKHAASGTHRAMLDTFPATSTGLTDAVKWYENQASLADYTLSLEDMVRFMSGKWSVKAQRDQAKLASDTLSAQAAEQRASAGIEETARRAAADKASNARSVQAQTEAEEAHTKPLTLVQGTVTPGPVLGEGWISHMVTVHDKAGDIIVNGIENMSPETLLGMVDYINDFLRATMPAQAEKLAA